MQFACFAVDMCRRIFTRVFQQKEKFIATESGPRLFCLHSSIAVPGMSRARSDLKVMKSAAKYFVGIHDFASFAANRGKSANRTDSSHGEPEWTTVRTINSVRVRKKGPCVTIDFDGDGFLYKMVRLMVGALVKCALGKMPVEDIAVRLKSSEPSSARFAAPAEGLFLVRVRY